jgi:hypothetical protein
MQIDTEEVAGSNPVVPTIPRSQSVNYRLDLFFLRLPWGSRGFDRLTSRKIGLVFPNAVENQLLGGPPFFCNRLLVNVHQDARVCMAEQFQDGFYVHPVPPQQTATP